jgi:hypothetical protein
MTVLNEYVRRDLAILIALVICSCSSASGHQPHEIGEECPCDADSGEMVLISAGRFAESCQVTVQEVPFTVARDRAGRIVYVDVADTRFETADGIRVGSTLADVLKAGAAVPQKEPGWAFHTLLPSGWRAAFTTGESLTDETPDGDSKVRWLFRRK